MFCQLQAKAVCRLLIFTGRAEQKQSIKYMLRLIAWTVISVDEWMSTFSSSNLKDKTPKQIRCTKLS